MLFEKIKLEADEHILLVVRRHWFVLVLRMLGVVFMAFAPLTIFVAATFNDTIGNMASSAYTNFSDPLLFFLSLWLLVSWMSMAHIWTDYYLDLWVVTDRRIIIIDQRRLFIRSVGSFRIEKLQDMNLTIPGFLATMFDYGHIEAQTASGDTFRGKYLPHPRELKSLVLEAADQRMEHSPRHLQSDQTDV